MSVSDQEILVCIPAFNESKTIAAVTRKARRYSTEVIVCDDGSQDNTDKIAEAAWGFCN